MAINRIRLPNGEDFNIEEWLHWPLYSVIEGAAGVGVDLRAFSYVVGQRVPQAGVVSTGPRDATEADTNHDRSSMMGHDEAFICFSMTYEHFALEGTTDQDSTFPVGPLDNAATAPVLSGTNLRIMQRAMMYEMFVGAGISKPQASAPLSYYGQGVGAVAYGSGDALAIANGGATALNLNYGTAGSVSPQNQRRWQLPVVIHSDRVFYVRLSTPGGPLVGEDQDWRLRLIADGLKRRPVA